MVAAVLDGRIRVEGDCYRGYDEDSVRIWLSCSTGAEHVRHLQSFWATHFGTARRFDRDRE